MSIPFIDNFQNKRENLLKRSRVIRTIRQFFDERSFIEVDTPVLQVCPVMDAHIHAFGTVLLGLDRRPIKDLYLQTSPELDMKKLLASGLDKIYQICPVFRNAENSKTHSAEFTLLEWYRSDADYTILMDEVVDMIRFIASTLNLKNYMHFKLLSDPFVEWQRITVCDAFEKYAKITLEDYLDDLVNFRRGAELIGIRVIDNDSWDDVFHAIMAEKIEPFLGIGCPTILYDYPISLAALSRKKPSNPKLAERFEVYICGIEIANAFSELTDPIEQRARYEEEMKVKKKLYGEAYPPDEVFFDALEYMPESAGIALGVDRLVMLSCDASDINEVLWVGKP